MATDESDLIRCANVACKCMIDPSETVCSDYCAAVDGWGNEVQTEICACGHAHCAASLKQGTADSR